MFVNGVAEGSSAVTSTVGDFTNTVEVGHSSNFGGLPLDGYLDEFRISMGIARWTSAFTPPTREYPLYAPAGNYTSQVFDAGGSSTWSSLNWTNTSSTGNNITFQVMSCDDASCSGETWVGPDNTSSTYFLTQPITLNTSITPNTQYFRYAAFFETDGTTSYLQDVNLSYSGLTTNATGEYTHTWTSSSTPGDYLIKVNSTYGNYYGENTQTLF